MSRAMTARGSLIRQINLSPAEEVSGRNAKGSALVDTDGRGLVIEPHPASVQDRDGGGPLLTLSRRSFPFIERFFADAGYAGERVAGATSMALEIVRKAPDQIGFGVQPRRWVVERSFAWIGRNRRLAGRPGHRASPCSEVAMQKR